MRDWHGVPGVTDTLESVISPNTLQTRHRENSCMLFLGFCNYQEYWGKSGREQLNDFSFLQVKQRQNCTNHFIHNNLFLVNGFCSQRMTFSIYLYHIPLLNKWALHTVKENFLKCIVYFSISFNFLSSWHFQY